MPTGLTTEKIKFESLAGVTIPRQCPACLKVHKWEKRKRGWTRKIRPQFFHAGAMSILQLASELSAANRTTASSSSTPISTTERSSTTQ